MLTHELVIVLHVRELVDVVRGKAARLLQSRRPEVFREDSLLQTRAVFEMETRHGIERFLVLLSVQEVAAASGTRLL